MSRKLSVKLLSLGLILIFLLGLRAWIFSFNNNEKELLASAEQESYEEEVIVPVQGIDEAAETVVLEPEKNNSEETIVSQPENNTEDISSKEITSEEAEEVIRKAYLNSICIFNRDVDRSEYIDEGIYCRPQDKQLSYHTILNTLKSYYTDDFIEKGNIADKALKMHEGKLYVLLLEGQYDYNSNFEILDIKSTEDTAEVRVKLITEYDTLESVVTLKQEEGSWKVADGVIFPQLP
ncbi:hypothetical protein ACPWSR_02635 [Alloiococcus sp. CFN-8]|uniref:hypothetical protein n=1 Tax=Alloiococcus sp. CFN-8 TaxID=3416081 RepID=UPI003CF021A6